MVKREVFYKLMTPFYRNSIHFVTHLKDLVTTDVIDYETDSESHEPIRQKLYRVATAKKDDIDKCRNGFETSEAKTHYPC